ncbi:1-phosphatidylinositol 4-kinase [Malassezia yamatoensis]|uniref:Phosphatidylinositol 4-kinase n=1 Tax=Malassezia yamatoensis TaxID=253288 RepID=A0AAJ6CJI0_9BASI|nr:1-phosphatidylinositol 4-kinase [Malassezia yamatoensis]
MAEEGNSMALENSAEERTPLLSSGAAARRSSFWPGAVGPRENAQPKYLWSVFEPEHSGRSPYAIGRPMDHVAFFRMVQEIETSIQQGVHPRMISAGTSGSYLVYVREGESTRVVAVFKPMDEEPYGNLNPKRVFLRKYFWWAMGRPCLIPNFSYLSEVGASFLDEQLGLNLVPTTRLIPLASPSFHYLYRDRRRHERGIAALPAKVGSLQQFLHGYENASEFLHTNPPPGRPRSLLEQDLDLEHAAHRLSRRKEKARLRMIFIAIKRLVLCRYGPGPYGSFAAEEEDQAEQRSHLYLDQQASAYPARGPMKPLPRKKKAFAWTSRTYNEFRLELEKLVVLDFLMRNTDRGLDNFMVAYDPYAQMHHRSVRIGAIDNSLAFPHQHPNGLRDYPYGWLFLPTNLIGGAFSEETRSLILPKLTDPVWWASTINGLRKIFMQDTHFHERVFQNQMDVMRGQGLNLVECLQHHDQGPIELCAYPKRLVRQSIQYVLPKQLKTHTLTDLAQGRIICADDRSEHQQPMDIDRPKRMSQVTVQAQSAPQLLGPAFGSTTEQLAIDVVEQMKNSVQHSSSEMERNLGSSSISRTPTMSSTSSFLSASPIKETRQMRSLDLAKAETRLESAKFSDSRSKPIPIVVERVELETRRPWLRWY